MKFFHPISIGKSGKVFLVALALSLVALGVYFFLFLMVGQKSRFVYQVFNDVETLSSRKESFKTIKDNVSKTVSLRDELDSYFIKKDEVVQFLNLVQALGADNNLETKVVSLGVDPAPVSPDVFETVNLEIQVSGRWAGVYHFAELLELMPLKLSVSAVNLEKDFAGKAQVSSDVSSKKVASIAAWTGVFDISVLKLK